MRRPLLLAAPRLGLHLVGRGFDQRKADREGRTASGARPQPHLSAVALHRVLDDRETETGAARASRASLVGAVEALEDALLVALGDPDAAVGDRDLHDAVDDLDAHADVRALRRVGDRVREQVADGLAEHLGIAAHVQAALAAADDLDAGRARLDGMRLDRGRHDLVDGDLALVGELVGRLQPREVHDARGEQRETGRLGGEARRRSCAPGRGRRRPIRSPRRAG